MFNHVSVMMFKQTLELAPVDLKLGNIALEGMTFTLSSPNDILVGPTMEL